jgi:hypothetical protein
MGSPWRSGLRSEGLDALREVMELAEDTLTSEQITEAVELAKMLLSSKKRRQIARCKLALKLPHRPTRPPYVSHFNNNEPAKRKRTK